MKTLTKKWLAVAAVAMVCVGVATAVRAKEDKVGPALQFKMKSLRGKEVDLADYQGKVVLMVNVASECGLTKQYKGLEELHERFGKDGLAVLGFPANEFGKQEPG